MKTIKINKGGDAYDFGLVSLCVRMLKVVGAGFMAILPVPGNKFI